MSTFPNDIQTATNGFGENIPKQSCTPERWQRWWRGLSGIFIFYGVCLVIIAIIVNLLYVLKVEGWTIVRLKQIYIFFYAIQLLAIAVLTGLAMTDQLSIDDIYKPRTKAAFIRAGLLALGSGGVLYRTVNLAAWMMLPDDCQYSLDLVLTVVTLIALILEIGYLYTYLKASINKGFLVAAVCRLIITHLIASKIIIWMSVVVAESLEEQHLLQLEEHDNKELVTSPNPVAAPTNDEVVASCQDLQSHPMLVALGPYFFPLIIEMCVLIASLWIVVWDNCQPAMTYLSACFNNSQLSQENGNLNGNATLLHGIPMLIRQFRYGRNKADVDMITSQQNPSPHSNYSNNGLGLMVGWLTVITSITITFVFLFGKYSDTGIASKEINLVYGTSAALVLSLCLSYPLAYKRLELIPITEKHVKNEGTFSNILGHKTDACLLTITTAAVVLFKVLSIVAASIKGSPLIIVEGVIVTTGCIMQNFFINAYASKKKCTHAWQRMIKPGRQTLEFMRFANFSIWLANTFLLKHRAAKLIMYGVYGTNTWVIISNILQPLVILHFFHAMVCIGELVTKIYQPDILLQQSISTDNDRRLSTASHIESSKL